tara:strand:+ start:12413 stop:12709 length:297 start_codon:yes stop_codon:yes gene_type:complete
MDILNAPGLIILLHSGAPPSGDEVSFDYAMRNYSIGYIPDQCRCGAGNCRGSITGWKKLPDSFKARYRGFVAPTWWTLIAVWTRSSNTNRFSMAAILF